ncbi:hypothetical protein PsorP6_000004 [Peronosclerospora sorghi]|uniref:Uncharacterized protein n=1 Tax=Peronosclerospora sorghi TaxID=230839 RepID=A0ACC0WUF9_9STRA|nr:hypothetical protein PsorP6_000004 [Peronosclerospora sorghi]
MIGTPGASHKCHAKRINDVAALHLASRQSIIAETSSSLFLIEKLMKLVSTMTLYGGPSAELYLKNMLDGI